MLASLMYAQKTESRRTNIGDEREMYKRIAIKGLFDKRWHGKCDKE